MADAVVWDLLSLSDDRFLLGQRRPPRGRSATVGRAAAVVGASGLLVRSAAMARGINVVVFPQAHRDDRLKVVEAEKLARLGVRLRA